MSSLVVSNLMAASKGAKQASVKGKEFLMPEALLQPLQRALVHQVIVAYQAGARSGSSQQKTRGQVRCTNQKPWKQKGTGRARAGSYASPIWVGGGVTFASSPRSYTKKVNRKAYRKAMAMLFAEQVRRSQVRLVDNLVLETHKTKNFIQLLAQNELLGLRVLMVVKDEINEALYFAARNVHHIAITNVNALNPLELYRADRVIVTQDALTLLVERLS
jgi:large subunit ribosomal protein L4